MNWCLFISVFWISSLLTALPRETTGICTTWQGDFVVTLDKQSSTPESLIRLQNLARSITVKVLAGKAQGSGIIIQKQEKIYTILTAKHVLFAGEPYRVQTPDGRTHVATLLRTVHLQNNDLSLLRFHSSGNSYSVASLKNLLTPRVGDDVFAAGFSFEVDPSNSTSFLFTTGKVSQLIARTLIGGYKVGYTNDVALGMSGGPILNIQGDLVGINGIHKYPLWGNPYIFKDGSVASTAVREQMSHFSWAIPVQTFLQLAPQFISKEN